MKLVRVQLPAGLRTWLQTTGLLLAVIVPLACVTALAEDQPSAEVASVETAAGDSGSDDVSTMNAPVLSADGSLAVVPARIVLAGRFEQQQLVVVRPGDGGLISDRSEDLTRAVKFESSDPAVAHVNAAGRVTAVSNGTVVVRVSSESASIDISVEVSGIDGPAQINYLRDVAPILSKAGCNMGACHATQHGQGGFKLSVFGFDASDDHGQIVRDRQQRRINRVDPAQSLFLLKPTMQVPHGGGKRLAADSPDHQLLVSWLAGGAAAPQNDTPSVSSLTVFPEQRTGRQGMSQQLRVDAHYSDGSVRDVTAWTLFDSMDEAMLEVTGDGYVSTFGAGQAPVMARFEGQAAIAMFVVPYRESFELADWQNNNFVDEHAGRKFQELGIVPSALCDDATFIRRAFLDATGTVPTIDQTRRFLADTAPDKREKLVDELLGLTGDPDRDIHNDNYAAYWTLKWSDLLRNSSNGNNVEQAMWAMHNWMKAAFRTNLPFDQFVSQLVTAKGSVYSNGPANYFRIFANNTDLAEATSQIFLGVRLECAKCHHHPFEKYGQADYYAFAAFFARVGTKRSEEFGLFGNESVVIVRTAGEVLHPKTRQRLDPTPLEGAPMDHPLDRRIALAEWFSRKDNLYFARSIVNRYVSYLLGRGLVEPVDDLRSTNPPTNPALMDALAQHFVDSGFDLKQLMRVIMVSRLYQLSSQPTEDNARDTRFYSHYLVKRLSAEPLLDAIDVATESPTKHQNLPPGTRAIELPDAEYPNYFLKTFAKPRRASVCECERTPDENLAQALHTLNGDTLSSKLSDANGRVARLVKADKPADEILAELYLAALCRMPSDAELAVAKEYVAGSPTPQEGYEDILWSLMNSRYFLFNH